MENPKKEPEAEKPAEIPVQEPSIKEERIRRITLGYYLRSDIRKAMYEFSKNRECVPRYFEGFGKRPDAFQFDSDIIELAKSGATSFHCSEELWSDPLELAVGLKEEELKKLRVGWDLLIDVDSKYLDYSKIYAEILIEVLNAHGIKNIGVKFSGSKGWHIILPWKAFPTEMSGKQTREMFPEWPRLICQYLGARIAEKLKNRVLELDIGKDIEKSQIEKYCSICNETPLNKSLFIIECPSCKTRSQLPGEVFEKKRKLTCSNCFKDLTSLKKESEIKKEEFLFCPKCNINSKTNTDTFKDRVKSQHIAADLILVSPRHLFRMPYSLHEKTSLASIVIPANKIKDFTPKDADPMKVSPINFIPDSEPNEASLLLQKALEFKPKEESQNKKDLQTKFNRTEIEHIEHNKNKESLNSNGTKKFSDFKINLTPDLYPPSIKTILAGMPSDGKKRALFILIGFFKSLKLTDEQLQFQIEEWNKKNKEPLPPSYIKGQLLWYAKQKEIRLPPNFDKSYYKDIGITPTPEELAAKNPVSYVIRKSFSKNYKSNTRNQSTQNSQWNKQKK